jgi:GDP-D-mannose 3', 5'-epimerase
MKRAVVCGAGGFIGYHLVNRLKEEGFWVRGVDLKRPEFGETAADEFRVADLRDANACRTALDGPIDELYQLAADMGGAGLIFAGKHDADIMHNSASINLNVLGRCRDGDVGKVFYSSSACVYPAYNQQDPDNPRCAEDSTYPAAPDSEYGWEKLFGERLYQAFHRNYGVAVRVARFHNVYGPAGTWRGGREKAPAALCRKVAEARDGDSIDIWGDGRQTRSFLYVDDGIDGVRRLVDSDFTGPVNIGSEEMVSIDVLAQMIVELSGKSLAIRHVPGPTGVRGRNSDNTLALAKIGWQPAHTLGDGLAKTYPWIVRQVARAARLPEPREAGRDRLRRLVAP